MRYSVLHWRPTAIVGRILFLGLIWLPCASGLAAPSSPLPPRNQVAMPAANTDPDALLIAVYEALSANRLKEAQAKADELVTIYPNFRLGHLIRGDLLMMHASAVRKFGATENAPVGKMTDLRDEAMARLNSLRKRPDLDLMPRSVLQLMGQQKTVLVVDAKNSRLYVYENQGEQLKLLSDYYISQGKFGTDKTREGDQKTPIGVYYITSHLAKSRLPDFYGAGALPINYPNEWDKANGRNGSGIWLHGTPSDSYSRPPLASDGCVVLTNQDLEKLFSSVQIGKTPVIISNHVEFIGKAKWQSERDAAIKMTNKWRHDAESTDLARLSTNYSKKFKSDSGDDLKAWLAKNRDTLASFSGQATKLRDVSLFRYPGQNEMIVGTFTQDIPIGKTIKSIRKRQYWSKEGSQWKIIYEANI
ncbi:murein L,D-transpeptidase family protein [Herminiimonas sp. CN]|uniref:L,D-transpeptidase family protein n=1 Tax=Herminiimonas sp. CN TaxID=1349818 RepID=UPI00068830FF|nr:L,D-transpeptidase family protein [Herminiimonas sp. CN]